MHMFIAYAIPIVQSLYVHMLNTIYMMILYVTTMYTIYILYGTLLK